MSQSGKHDPLSASNRLTGYFWPVLGVIALIFVTWVSVDAIASVFDPSRGPPYVVDYLRAAYHGVLLALVGGWAILAMRGKKPAPGWLFVAMAGLCISSGVLSLAVEWFRDHDAKALLWRVGLPAAAIGVAALLSPLIRPYIQRMASTRPSPNRVKPWE